MKQPTSILRSFLITLNALAMLGYSSASRATEISDGLTSVPLAEIQVELTVLPGDIRANMTRDQMARFISNMLLDRRLEKAAMAAGTADLPNVQASIARETRNVVVRAYVDGETTKLSQTLPSLEGLAKERYVLNKASYVIPEAIRVAHILFRVNPEDPQSTAEAVRAKAETILVELHGGADFGALAEKYSDDTASARNKGELSGWYLKGQLVPTFEEAAYAMKPGEISGLVRSRFGYHIIKLLEIREGKQLTFEEVKEQILTSLRNEILGQKREEWMKAFKGTKPIVLDDATLEALKKP